MTDTPKSASTFRRSLAGVLDFLTIFFVGGYLIAKLTGDDTSGGFSLNGAPALALFGLIVAYFWVGWKQAGGTIWQRILGVV